MKLLIGIQIVLSVIGILIYIQLLRYCKKHAEEEIKLHSKKILSGMIAMVLVEILIAVAGILNIL
ncbi:MAG: hypothetical protein J6A75_03795 [Lachnospiraceae bacterium]|nr:hypothetical protein [Lachnospiraceae bacterium]